MNKFLRLLLVLIFAFATLPLRASNEAPSQSDYEANRTYESSPPIGYGAQAATSKTISMSMIGWGLGLVLAIALIAGIAHQSSAVHSDSN